MTPNTRRTWILIAIASQLALSAAWAKPEKTKAAPKTQASPAPETKPSPTPAISLQEPRDIESVREELFKIHKSKKAKSLAKATLALQDGKTAEARKLAQPLQKDPLYADSGIFLTAHSHRMEAAEQISKKKFAEGLANAQKAFSLFIKIQSDHPYSGLLKKVPEGVAQAELLIADAHAGLGRRKNAQDAYERAFQRLALEGDLGTLTPEQLGAYAQTCAKNQSLLCPLWIQRFVSMHAKGSEEIAAIGKNLPDSVTRATPPRAEGKVTQAYKAPDLDTAAFEAAMGHYSRAKYGDAANELLRFNDEFPKSALRHRARYWLAQSLLQEKEPEKANPLFEEVLRETPLSYYGLLAAIALNRPIDTQITATLPPATPTDAFMLPQEAFRLKRAEQLVVEGATSLASEELKSLRPRDTLSEGFLLYLAMLNAEAGNHAMGFQILSHLIQRGSPVVHSSFGLRLVFPVAHYEKIQAHASQSGVDPILVLSLIKQESAFDPLAGSHVGATGLMQLMPRTASDVEPKVTRASLTEVETNVRVGTKYLKRMLNKYQGNIVLALAAYNAGPGSVDRWLKANVDKQLGMLDFIESIPYRETREYVGSIIRNYYWYSKRLTGDAPKTLGFFWNTYGPPANPAELPPTTQQ